MGVQIRFRLWHLAALLVVFCVGVVAAIELIRIRSVDSPLQLTRHLPSGDGAVLFIDVSALRDAGLLDLLMSADVDEESEYRRFVNETGFDYTEDLDAVAAAFHTGETFLMLKGRFDWGRLVEYTEERGGDCYNGFCRVPGSEPTRQISFVALSPMVLAVAVSRDNWAASAIIRPSRPDLEQVPDQPLWMMMSGKALKRSDWLPTGTRAYVSAIGDAGLVTLSVGEDGDDFEATLNADCGTETEAQRLTTQMQSVTAMLQSLIRREHKEPNPRDLSGVLTAGEFESQGTRVHGRWPIPRAFLDAVITGTD